MAETEGGAKDCGDHRVSDPSQALTVILQLQYLRYVIIACWTVGLLGVIPWWQALIWFVATMAAGGVRGVVEHRVSHRRDGGWGMVFPAVATLAGSVWAVAPLMAWFSHSPFGQTLAIALLISGYVLVFSQLRSSPLHALIISSPYTAVVALMLASLWGTSAFWSMLAILPFSAVGLFLLVTITMLRESRIEAFQAHQAHLIEELEAARDKANAASEAKSNFLGVISHELRTPMNGVLGAAQLLSATRLEGAQREYLAIIRNSGDNLLSLLNDILDMTKIEAGKMTFEVVDVVIEDLNRRITGPFEAQAEAKGLTFTSRFEGEMPAVVRGDPLRVCQVVQNLLSNAVKFTDVGEIRYVVRAKRLSDRRVSFEFSVTDSGAGISPSDLARLFQPFTQVDASSTRRFGGTGLGLTIARRMANIMGGDITVTSEVGRGSCFTLTVEAEVVEWATAAPEQQAETPVDDGVSLRVLVVEDHPVNRMILEAWMATASHSVVTAEDGEKAVAAAAEQPFDLIIMDVNMPVMDGLTATRRIREGGGANADAPIVVLSASARNEDHQAGLDAGADAYLTKPIDFGALAEMLGRVPGGREAVGGRIKGQEQSVAA